VGDLGMHAYMSGMLVFVPVLADVTPLRVSADFRRLFVGLNFGQLGQQMTAVAIAIQVYDLTKSSFAVGTVGIVMLVPMVIGGLYGGALADVMDRRKLAIITAFGLWVLSMALFVATVLGLHHVGTLYLIVGLQAGLFAVNSPTRSAIIPRILPPKLIPAANALSGVGFNIGLTVGPMLGAVIVAWKGYQAAYLTDVVLYTGALYALIRLPAVPPIGHVTRAGWSTVVDGLRYLRTNRVVLASFAADLIAMVLASPRALFPAAAGVFFAGGPRTVGLLQSAPAIGAVVAMVFSGWLTKVKRHGLAVIIAIVCWGLAIAGFGLTGGIIVGVVMLALAGAADSVSSVFRNTIMQVATPDEMRGRLQGVFVVVVAGGPRLGDFLAGTMAEAFGLRVALIAGGLACVIAIIALSKLLPELTNYIRRERPPISAAPLDRSEVGETS
jgi:MFS family permease